MSLFAISVFVLFSIINENVESSSLKFGRSRFREDPEVHMNTVRNFVRLKGIATMLIIRFYKKGFVNHGF